MKIQLAYSDSLIVGIDNIFSTICSCYELTSIPMEDVLNNAIIKDDVESKKIKRFIEKKEVIPAEIYHDLLLSIINNGDQATGFLIHNYPRTEPQWNLLKKELDLYNLEIDVIWYFQSINLIKNLNRVEKYKNMAAKADPSFAHIKKYYIQIKSLNCEILKIINKLDITQIIDVDAYGFQEGQNSVSSVAETIRLEKAINNQTP